MSSDVEYGKDYIRFRYIFVSFESVDKDNKFALCIEQTLNLFQLHYHEQETYFWLFPCVNLASHLTLSYIFHAIPHPFTNVVLNVSESIGQTSKVRIKQKQSCTQM